MTAKQISDEMRKYLSHKSGAASRGIPFLFTFEQWWEIWQHSGHWHERGHGKDKYCMARPGDIGPYAVGNVKIVTNSEILAKRESIIGSAVRVAARLAPISKSLAIPWSSGPRRPAS